MPSPTVASTTASTPSIIPIATTPTIASIAVDGGTSPSSRTTSTATLATTLATCVNDHAARHDISMMAMNGLYVIMRGLDLSWTSGLTVNIAAGQAFVEGVREIVATTKVVGDNATTRLWMDYSGAILSGTGAYAPTLAVFLGTVTTLAGVVTVIDVAGVLKMQGGIPVRQVADTVKPVDTPTSLAVFLTVTNGAGSWLWNGTKYLFLDDRKATVAITDAATIATDVSLGDVFTVTLAGNRTLGAPTNPQDRQKCRWLFKQDGTGSRTLALNAIFHVPTGITVTLSTTAAKIDILEAEYSTFAAAWLVTNFQKGY